MCWYKNLQDYVPLQICMCKVTNFIQCHWEGEMAWQLPRIQTEVHHGDELRCNGAKQTACQYFGWYSLANIFGVGVAGWVVDLTWHKLLASMVETDLEAIPEALSNVLGIGLGRVCIQVGEQRIQTHWCVITGPQCWRPGVQLLMLVLGDHWCNGTHRQRCWHMAVT